MTSLSRLDRLRDIIQKNYAVGELVIEDESHLHGGGRLKETHFKVYLVSSEFDGVSRVDRSRKLQSLLKEELQTGLHALAQRLLTPEEAKSSPVESFISPECLGGSGRKN